MPYRPSAQQSKEDAIYVGAISKLFEERASGAKDIQFGPLQIIQKKNSHTGEAYFEARFLYPDQTINITDVRPAELFFLALLIHAKGDPVGRQEYDQFNEMAELVPQKFISYAGRLALQLRRRFSALTPLNDVPKCRSFLEMIKAVPRRGYRLCPH